MLQHPTEASSQGHVSSSSSAHACRAHSLVLEYCDQWRCPRVLRPPSCTNAPPATAKPPTSDRKCGERKVKTDTNGRFEARGAAIGAIGVALGTDRGPDQGGSRVRFDPVLVVLDGTGRYAPPDIALREWELY